MPTPEQEEIARLQEALKTIANIPHMGPYIRKHVQAAIEKSEPWSNPWQTPDRPRPQEQRHDKV